jgi:hypothetical protein
MGARKIETEDIKKINELYLQHKTYAAVGRIMQISPTTVKKYIIKDYMSETKIIKSKFEGVIKNINEISFPSTSEEWVKWLLLSDEEWSELNDLKREILI